MTWLGYCINNIQTTLVLDDVEFEKEIMISEPTKTDNFYVCLEDSPQRTLQAPLSLLTSVRTIVRNFSVRLHENDGLQL
jgi:hypothetical protein